MRPLLTFMLLLELSLAIYIGSNTCLLRSEMIHAGREVLAYPSPETYAELHRQQGLSLLTDLSYKAVLFALLAGPTIMLLRRRPTSAKSNRDPVTP